jgi:chorismate mutase
MVNTLYWFRKALRLHDNPSLVRALQDASHVTPVFCLVCMCVCARARTCVRVRVHVNLQDVSHVTPVFCLVKKYCE